MTLLLMILFTLNSSRIFADVGLKSGFDNSGSFNNRLQFDGESLDFSLLSSISPEGLEWIEPDVFMNPLFIGRIQLKGLVREIHNQDGTSPAASVLAEASGLRVTDSMSRSTRYGVLITPFKDYDLSGWIYRANSGILSSGILFNQPDIIRNQSFRVEGDFLLTAGCYKEGSGSGWFGSKAVYPRQVGVNAAVEIRASTDKSGNIGRRMLLPSGEKISWSLSITAAGAMPQYTAAGGLIRAMSVAGNRNLYLRTLFQSVSPNYISPSGSPSSCELIAGTGITTSLDTGFFGINAEIDYCQKRKMREVIPSRYVGQANIIDGSLELTADMFFLKLNGNCRSVYELSGIKVVDAGFDGRFGFDAGVIRMDIGYSRRSTAVGKLVSWEDPGIDAGISFIGEVLRMGVSCGYEDQFLSLKTDTVIATDDYRISGSLKFENASIAGLTVGFEI